MLLKNKKSFFTWALAVLAAIRHSTHQLAFNIHNLENVIEMIIICVSDGCVPFFFCISGYLFFNNVIKIKDIFYDNENAIKNSCSAIFYLEYDHHAFFHVVNNHREKIWF